MNEAIKLYQETNMTVEKILRETGVSKSSFYREVKKLGLGKRDLLSTRSRKYGFNIEKFKENSRDKYYWIGFIMADGAIVNNSLVIELKNTDKKHLEKFNRFSENENPLAERINNNGCECVKATINSKELVNYLDNFSIRQNKSKIVEIKNIPSEYAMDFIRGYVDGDGTISFRNGQIYLSIVSGSYKLIQQIEDVLKIGNKITNYGTYYKIATLGNNKAFSTIKKLYEDSTENTRLDRKYKTYLALALK